MLGRVGKPRKFVRSCRASGPLLSRLAIALTCTSCLVNCGSAAAPPPNRTFYDWSLGDRRIEDFEIRRAALDWPRDQTDPEFLGVEVLGGAVRFSRPREWLIRNASREPGAAYVQYISPSAYAFTLYQRPDPPSGWTELLQRYEAEVKAGGGRILGRGIPMATSRGQGRAFTIETTVKTSAGPIVSLSREILVRGAERLVLLQVVHQRDDLAVDNPELLRAVGSLEVH